MWMERLRKFRRDHRGLSLIELVCAVAILGIITTTVGGAMVVASDSYRRGTTESALQQEAQFTANTIESLVVDVTKQVSWDGTNLVIENDSVTYTITYDPGAQTLSYSDGTDSGVLIAEHVSGFNVYGAADFASTRNLSLSLSMKNGSSGFTTDYSITSRNNADAISAVAQKATIKVIREIVMEPNQTLSIPVTIMGPAGATFTCASSDSNMTVAKNGNNIDIALTEFAGKTDDFYTISVNAVDGAGNALVTTEAGGGAATIKVCVRRVRESASGITLTNTPSNPTKNGCVYDLKVNWGGANLNQFGGNTTDVDYIDPYTQVWSYKITDQTGVELNKDEYFEASANASVLRLDTFSFKLKKDMPEGSTITVYATNLHSQGDDNGSHMNKASRDAGSSKQYDSIVKVKWEVTLESNSDILRGDDQFVQNLGMNAEQFIKANSPAGADVGNVFEVKCLYRFISDDGTSFSAGWPNWIVQSEGGYIDNGFQVRPPYLGGMDFDKGYKLQVCFRARYRLGTDYNAWFPVGDSYATWHPDVVDDSDYIFEYHVSPFSVKINSMTLSGTSDQINLSEATSDKTGVGSLAKPLELKRGWYGIYCNYYGAAAEKGAIDDLINNRKVYKYVSGTWQSANVEMQRWGNDRDARTLTLGLGTQNNIDTNVIYKIVFTKAGDVSYAEDTGSGPSKGVIYFKVIN